MSVGTIWLLLDHGAATLRPAGVLVERMRRFAAENDQYQRRERAPLKLFECAEIPVDEKLKLRRVVISPLEVEESCADLEVIDEIPLYVAHT